MSLRAYLDSIEDKTGLVPRALTDQAKERGYDAPTVKAGTIIAWLDQEYGPGRGHAMALVHGLKKGPTISAEHVGTSGTHRDASTEL